MKTVIRPEAEMKTSGIEWVGLIPKDWKIAKNNRLFNISKKLVGSNWKNTQLLSLTKSGIIEKNINDGGGKQPESFETYQYVENNDVVLCLFDIDVSAVFSDRSKYSGMISPAYRVMKCTDAILSVYAKWWFDAVNIGRYYLIYTKSLRKTIDATGFGNILTAVPSLSEQQAIADYLDETCSKIDEIIAEAKASIDEYKELKQSVIFEAVTKGLDKNIIVYKTGNSWIPFLPAGVKLSRFGLHHDIILGKMLCPNPRNEEDTLEPYYCAANVHFDGVTGELKTMWFNSKEKETYVVHKNDMLIVEGGAGAGGAAIMNEEPPVSTFVQNSIMIVRSHMKDNRYSCYLVQALVKNKYVDVVCNKATIPHFTKEKVSCMPYPVFNRNERNEIANYLDEKCKQIDSLISEKESLINDLEAYKKSLIYEVVTGKRRVV